MVRKYFVRADYGSFQLARLTLFSKIVVGEKATVVIGLKPMVKMDLIQVGRNKFLSQFVAFAAQEGNLQPGKSGNKRLRDSIRTAASAGVRRFHFGQRAVITSSRCG